MLFVGIYSSYSQYDYPGNEVTDDKEQPKKEKKAKNPEVSSRLFFGGNIGMSFSYYTYIQIAPTVGYKITPRLWVGIGPEYIYQSIRAINYQSSIYGIRNFASFAILNNINEVININIGSVFLYAENELLSIRPAYADSSGVLLERPRKWYDIVLGGFGLRIPLGDRAGLSLIALWGLNKNAEMLYSSPEIRMSFDF